MGGNPTRTGASVAPSATYSERVRLAVIEAQKAAGLSDAEFAKVTGIARSTLQRRLVRGDFSAPELELIAAALDVPVEQFGAPGRAA